MQLRDVNVNIRQGASAASAKKPASVSATTATYISPPRNAAATAANTRPPQQQQQQQHHFDVQASVMPEEGVLGDAQGGCPCPTCAYYRAYYAQQMQLLSSCCAYSSHRHMQQQPMCMAMGGTAPAPHMVPHCAPKMPIMALKSREERERAAAAAQPPPQQPTAMAPAATATSPLTTALGTFYSQHRGRVAESACTAAGKADLQVLLRTMQAAQGTCDQAEAAAAMCAIVEELSAAMDTVALDDEGCHVLRAVVYGCDAEQTAQLVATFHETLVLNMCTVSQYTRRTLQALFERSLVDLTPLVDVIARNTTYLAATEQGCIALMRVYENCSPAHKAQLMEPLLPSFPAIAHDPFGNYVVQCAVEKSGVTAAAQYTVSCFSGRLLAMSCNKFASNVVEAIVRSCYGVPAVRRLLLDELIYNPAALRELVADPYGNFVVQRILEATTSPAEIKRIADRVRPTLPYTRYATKIEAKLKMKKSNGINNGSGNLHHHQQQQQQRSTMAVGSRPMASNPAPAPAAVYMPQQQCESFGLPTFQPHGHATAPTASTTHTTTTYPTDSCSASFPSSSSATEAPAVAPAPALTSRSASAIVPPPPPMGRTWQPPRHMRLGAHRSTAASSTTSAV